MTRADYVAHLAKTHTDPAQLLTELADHTADLVEHAEHIEERAAERAAEIASRYEWNPDGSASELPPATDDGCGYCQADDVCPDTQEPDFTEARYAMRGHATGEASPWADWMTDEKPEPGYGCTTCGPFEFCPDDRMIRLSEQEPDDDADEGDGTDYDAETQSEDVDGDGIQIVVKPI